MVSEKSCGVVVFREELPKRLYLLLHYEEGHWDFPKGHAEEGEKETDTAFRELKEETGLTDIELILGFRERIEYTYKKGGNPVFKEVILFLGRTDTKEILLSFEHIGSEWLPFAAALKKITYQNSRDVLKKAENHLRGWGTAEK